MLLLLFVSLITATLICDHSASKYSLLSDDSFQSVLNFYQNTPSFDLQYQNPTTTSQRDFYISMIWKSIADVDNNQNAVNEYSVENVNWTINCQPGVRNTTTNVTTDDWISYTTTLSNQATFEAKYILHNSAWKERITSDEWHDLGSSSFESIIVLRNYTDKYNGGSVRVKSTAETSASIWGLGAQYRGDNLYSVYVSAPRGTYTYIVSQVATSIPESNPNQTQFLQVGTTYSGNQMSPPNADVLLYIPPFAPTDVISYSSVLSVALPGDPRPSQVGLIVGLVIGGFALLILPFVAFLIYRKIQNRKKSRTPLIADGTTSPTQHPVVDLEQE